MPSHTESERRKTQRLRMGGSSHNSDNTHDALRNEALQLSKSPRFIQVMKDFEKKELVISGRRIGDRNRALAHAFDEARKAKGGTARENGAMNRRMMRGR